MIIKTSFKNRNNLNIVLEVHEQGKSKIAFIMHGLSGSKDQSHIVFTKNLFLECGYTVICFDTTNSFGESDGLHELTTVTQNLNDLEDLVMYAKKQEWYREQFLLCGFSLGGYVTIAFTEKYPELVKATISVAPIISGEIYHEVKKKFQPEMYFSWKEKGVFDRKSKSRPGLIRRLPWSYMEDMYNHNLYLNIDKLKKPILLIACEYDTSCPVYTIKPFFEKIPSDIKKLSIIKGSYHAIVEPEHIEQFYREVKSFLNYLV